MKFRPSSRFILVVLPALAVSFTAASLKAEQLKVSDPAKAVVAMEEIAAGRAADVLVKAGGDLKASIVAVLRDESTGAEKGMQRLDNEGKAYFRHVMPGAYTVQTAGEAKISEIKIISNDKGQAGLSRERARQASRAMYVAGASAVAGFAGLAAAVSEGSKDGGSVGFDASSGGNAAGGGAAGGSIGGASSEPQVLGATVLQDAPDPGAINPPPEDGTFNPPANSSGPGLDENDDAEHPGGGGNIVPAPPLTDPMTPS